MGTGRILVVEDDDLVRVVVAEVLIDAGFSVDAVANGDKAAELLDGATCFDLVVTDLQMPGRFDGRALAAHVRARRPGLPFLFTSGRPEKLAEIDRAGSRDATLQKPFGPSRILEVITRLLGESGVSRCRGSAAA